MIIMACILCNKEINGDQKSLEVYTTDNKTIVVHHECYEEYVKSILAMSCIRYYESLNNKEIVKDFEYQQKLIVMLTN